MENIEKAPNVPPFVRYCAMLIPTVFDDSLSYYEALCALSNWVQNNLVEVVNHNAEVTEEYIQLTNDLKAYVENYFENLDVQEEINNKLDEMAESGTLTELINTIQVVNVNHLGIMPNETYTTNLDSIISDLPSGSILYFPKGTYTFNTATNVINIDKPLTILGDGEDTTIIKNIGSGDVINVKLETEEKRFVYIEKMTLDSGTSGKCVNIHSESGYYLAQFRMYNVKTVNGDYGFYLNGVTGDNLFLSSFEDCTFYNPFYAKKIGDTIRIEGCNFAFDSGIYIDQVAGASSLLFQNNNVTGTGGFVLDVAAAPLISNNIFEMSRDTTNENGYIEICSNVNNRQFEYTFTSNTISYASGYDTPNKPLLYINLLSNSKFINNVIGVKDNNYSISLSSNSKANYFDNTYGISYASATIAYAMQDNGTDNIIKKAFVDGNFYDGITTSSSYDKFTGKKSITGNLQLINSNLTLASTGGSVPIQKATYVDDYHVSSASPKAYLLDDGLLPLDLLVGGLSNHVRVKFMQYALPSSGMQAGDLYINKQPSTSLPYMFYYYNGSAFKGVGQLNDL